MTMQDTTPILNARDRIIEDYSFELRINETGYVVTLGDGIAWISGLPSAAMDDVINFHDGSVAVVFDLNRDMVGAVLLVQTEKLTAGVAAFLDRHLPIRVPVGDGLLGRVINPLGEPVDGKGKLENINGSNPLETQSPQIIARDFVNRPLYTGCKIIDTMIPVGKGQRQLLLGDEGLGRSSLAIDTVINQRDKNVICIYVFIGQRRSNVVNAIDLLEEYGAMEHTVVVVAEASDLPGLQHLAPFAGCAIAESWMQQGRDTLIIYDDLSTHARTYRELSLLLRRPPGREAYPGDIFSVHARLLERSTCLNAANGGGSMTALPIIGTNEGEIADYIPTNLISITDGQIYLDHGLYTSGFRPAIDISKSVSRIGGQAQHPRIKTEAGRMKLDYLQFQELELFTRFGTKLEASMQTALKRGHVLRELLKQGRFCPMPVNFQLAWLIAFNAGYLDEMEPDELHVLMDKFADYIGRLSPSLDDSENQWKQIVSNFFESDQAIAG